MPGTALEPSIENVAIAVEDIPGLLAFAQKEAIDLTIIGPEVPLVMGIVDRFQEAGTQVLWPHRQKPRNWKVPRLFARTS